MKNIHIIPTDKPSRLFNCFGKLNIGDYITSREDLQVTNQNIYITSDEEIKEGKWVFNFEYDYISKYDSKIHDFKFWYKKIILTTDQDLIKDGVQAIDDEFLEWFVKNPSCEEVETYSLGIQNVETGESGHYKYEIIIPQEEHTQETLEEAADKTLQDEINYWYEKTGSLTSEDIVRRAYSLGITTGAKWQAERMYSEEDMIEFGFSTYCYISELMGVPFNLISENRLNAEEWFEQFKKK